MPAVIPAHIVLRTRLKDSVTHAVDLGDRLEGLIAIKSRQPGSFHGKVDHSQPPWNAPAAYAITSLHALSRRMERDLREDRGLSPLPRGGSHANTRKALEAVVVHAEVVDDFMVRLCTRELDRWWRSASIALNEIEVPKRLPRSPGKPEPRCPFCNGTTLRVKIMENDIRCISPKCIDADGNKPVARMEYSVIAGDYVVRWQDGIIMGQAA